MPHTYLSYTMDNEQPWQPPQQHHVIEIPKLTPQVPDVTLYSGEQTNNRLPNNFLQRAMKVNGNFHNTSKPPPTRALANPLLSIPVFNSEMHIKPSVPDVSLLNPQALNPTNRMNSGTNPLQLVKEKTSTNLVFQSSSRNLKENIFGKPSVPEVTILEESVSTKQQFQETRSSSEPVFSESYKKMLINSHDQFMKQIKHDKSMSPESSNPQKKKSTLFNSQTNNYRENPLRKYAPKPQPPRAPENDHHDRHNSSSILMDFEKVLPDKNSSENVAEMMNNLVIPEADQNEEENLESKPKKCEIMRRLAFSYLSPEEIELYGVERELQELEEIEDLEET